MTPEYPPIPWFQEGWQQQVDRRTRQAIQSVDYDILSESEQVRVSPWSEVRRTLTDHGAVYMKTTAPVLRYEIALTQKLESWRPDLMPVVLASDETEGWMLLEDAGDTLRSRMESPADLKYWQTILPVYAEFQQQMIAHQEELLNLQILDRRLEVLPSLFASLLEDREMLLIEQEDGLTKAQYVRLRELIPFYMEGCDQLAAFGIPQSIHHDDFHDGNIFLKDGKYTLADWGETCLAHPFFTMNVTLRSAAYRVGLEANSPEITELRDLYLKCWSQYGDLDTLREALDLALKLATVSRALTWYQVLKGVDEIHRAAEIDAVPGWLAEYLEVAS